MLCIHTEVCELSANIQHKLVSYILGSSPNSCTRPTWGIPSSGEFQNNNSFKSDLNQIILKTKNRFVKELKRCCNVQNELLCPDRGKHLFSGSARVFSQNPQRVSWNMVLQTDVKVWLEDVDLIKNLGHETDSVHLLCKPCRQAGSFLCCDMTIHNLNSSFNYTYSCYVISIGGRKISESYLNYQRQNFCFYLLLDRARRWAKHEEEIKKKTAGETESEQIFLFYIPFYSFMMLPSSVSNIHFCLIKAALCEQYEDFHWVIH